MSRKRQHNTPRPAPAACHPGADVLTALERDGKRTATRRRDLISGVKRVAILLGEEPAAILLDMPAIAASSPSSTPWPRV